MGVSFGLLAESAISGIFAGGVLALIALGLTLVWGVMGILNLAHTDFLMLAMFGCFLVVTGLQIHPYLSLFIMVPVFFLLGMVVMRYLIKPILGQGGHHLPVIISIGLMLLFQSGSRTVMYQLTPLNSLAIGSQYWMGTLSFFGINISIPRLLAFVTSVAMVLFLFWFIQKTELGETVRAYAENSTAATLMGINVGRLQLIVFGIGIACVSAAAALLIPMYPVEPQIGQTFSLSVFAIVAMGGLGNFWGTLLAGLVIGLAEGIAGVFIAGAAIPLVSLGILVVTLIFRPEGVLGRRGSWLGA